MTLATNLRTGRHVALLAAAQVAKGTPVTNFGSGPVLFTHSTELPPGPEYSEENWMAETIGAAPEECFIVSERPAGRFLTVATPDVMDLLLRSNWGSKSGSNYNLAYQPSEW